MENDEIEDALLEAREICQLLIEDCPAKTAAEMALPRILAALERRRAEQPKDEPGDFHPDCRLCDDAPHYEHAPRGEP